MSPPPVVALIAALSRNRVIGRENRLPWHLPEDLKYFREVTRGHPVLLGRKTFDSIGRPLPGRQNIVITRQAGLSIPGCDVVGSLEEGIARARPTAGVIFVLGGEQIYRQALPMADRLYLTLVDLEIEGDAYFPEWEGLGFKETESQARRDPESGISYRFTVWNREAPSRP